LLQQLFKYGYHLYQQWDSQAFLSQVWPSFQQRSLRASLFFSAADIFAHGLSSGIRASAAAATAAAWFTAS
jgi:hypothetical protein